MIGLLAYHRVAALAVRPGRQRLIAANIEAPGGVLIRVLRKRVEARCLPSQGLDKPRSLHQGRRWLNPGGILVRLTMMVSVKYARLNPGLERILEPGNLLLGLDLGLQQG